MFQLFILAAITTTKLIQSPAHRNRIGCIEIPPYSSLLTNYTAPITTTTEN